MNNSKNTQNYKWWQTGIIYQIYPLTFADGNGDGIGDLQGIIQRLDYLNDGNPDSKNSLGVDAIWLSPINKSPMLDNGYDVSDYYDICPLFGTLDDFKLLLKEAHQRNIKVIIDLVVNHTSNEHPWFIESSSSRDNPKADWYQWQNPMVGNVPNNWLSYFGGTGWTYNEKREQYYFHTFNKNQPDVNWHNPELKQEMYKILRYWLDLGIDGFRLDASSVYIQDKFYRDNPIKFGATDKNAYNNQHHLYDKNLPENHQIIREMRQIVDEYPDKVLIGETFIDNHLDESLTFYGIDNDELHLPFAFEFPFSPWYPGYLQREIEKQEKLTPSDAWPTYFIDNHDLPRHLSRWITCTMCTEPVRVAKAAATLLLTLRGTPILYYGQELGMENHLGIPPEKIRDKAVIFSLAQETPPPRDGGRTPMQWDNSACAGFSFGQEVDPWLPVHENYQEVNVATELEDEDSILNFYRQIIKIRQNSEALQYGEWKRLIYYPEEQLSYLRVTENEQVIVILNFSYHQDFKVDEPLDLKNWRVLIAERFAVGEVIDIPKTLEPFEILILQKED